VQPDSLRSLQQSLNWIDELIRAAVERARVAGFDPTDALRGLVITDDEVQQHLANRPLDGLWAEEPVSEYLQAMTLDEANPLRHLVEIFQLSPLDCQILLVCLAPELDRRYERLYAYLQDDVTQRRPTINLVINLLSGQPIDRFAVWNRLLPNMPLRAHRLIEASTEGLQPNATFLANQLKLDHRIVMFLLGDSTPDPRLLTAVTVAREASPGAVVPNAVRIALDEAAQREAPIVFMHGLRGTGRHEAATTACVEAGLPLVIVDLRALKDLDMPYADAWELGIREAKLQYAGLMLAEWDACLDTNDMQPPPDLWEAITRFERIVFLAGTEPFEPLDSMRKRRMLRVSYAMPPYDVRYSAWQDALADHNISADTGIVDELASKFKLTRVQVNRAVNTASDLAVSRGEPVTREDLIAGAQAHSSLKLGRLAKRIVPRFQWNDLILPPDRVQVLQEICARIRYSHVVNDSWGYAHRVAAAPGVTALFAGESGTGKTLAAEVIARDLGLLLYKIDLSAVVSKYIGETEKNLSVIFEEAHQSNAVLFFDEADALFGKRSEVKDAHDRYANLEVAYLLQQLESYEGVAILATNLRQNLDEAFTRRLSFLVDFPFPESEYRQKLWATHFPPEAPLGKDVDLMELSDRFALAGGNIRNAAIASAYLAASDGGMITMSHLRHAIKREHQKMGRLLDDDY
jgi:hypothetical protein